MRLLIFIDTCRTCTRLWIPKRTFDHNVFGFLCVNLISFVCMSLQYKQNIRTFVGNIKRYLYSSRNTKQRLDIDLLFFCLPVSASRTNTFIFAEYVRIYFRGFRLFYNCFWLLILSFIIHYNIGINMLCLFHLDQTWSCCIRKY